MAKNTKQSASSDLSAAHGYVYLLMSHVDYEGSYVIDVYANKADAEAKQSEIEEDNAKSAIRNREWLKATDAEEDADKWPECPTSSEYHGEDISVHEHELLSHNVKGDL